MEKKSVNNTSVKSVAEEKSHTKKVEKKIDQSQIVERKETKVSGLPNGLSKEQYKGYTRWTKRQWAWEFLRRNVEFRKRCKDLLLLPEKEQIVERREIARTFGLKTFKDCDATYGKKGEKKQPSFNAIAIFFDTENKNSKIRNLRLRKDQVLIRFDLRPAFLDKGALDEQLSKAKIKLERRLKLTGKETSKRNQLKRDVEDDLRYLRMLDAKSSKSGTESAIYAELTPMDPIIVAKATGWKDDARQKFKNTFPTAIELAERGYLTLALSSNFEKNNIKK